MGADLVLGILVLAIILGCVWVGEQRNREEYEDYLRRKRGGGR